MTIFLLTLGGMGIVMMIMAVGIVFSGRCLQGSCGGLDAVDGESLNCDTCSNRKTHVL
jgi:hypothetical protein